jgi:type VI protein secretion system component VasF
VRDHGETGEALRLELLEHHPVADNVLDAVRHHRERRKREIRPETGMTERRERDVRRRAPLRVVAAAFHAGEATTRARGRENRVCVL